jgi:hypothetical protein
LQLQKQEDSISGPFSTNDAGAARRSNPARAVPSRGRSKVQDFEVIVSIIDFWFSILGSKRKENKKSKDFQSDVHFEAQLSSDLISSSTDHTYVARSDKS